MFLILTFFSSQAFTADIRVIDADSIELGGVKIRLFGIDAPEITQECEDTNGQMYACGKHSTGALKGLIEAMSKNTIACNYNGKDTFGRFLGECSIGNININEWLVENGWALAYLKYSKKYIKNENIAKRNRAGIWVGKFVEPWSWRRGERLYSQYKQADNDCLIKGNISSGGEKIYHVKSGQDYGRTKISLEKGERWFCTEKKAREHGWRKSKQ